MIEKVLWFLAVAGTLFGVLGLWIVVSYFLNPHIDNPHGKARITGQCGDTMEIGLQFRESRVLKASYWTDGCLYSLNCVCAAARLAEGKSPDEILSIDPDVIQESIGGLPKDHMHCARLAAETLLTALDDHMLKACRYEMKPNAPHS
jgi:nitrogen fixation protein NifU and related proteins